MATVSIRDVAARAAVSVGTVSNVLNRPERVAAATVASVQSAIEELGFVRNEAARQLRVGASNTIGLVVLDAGNPFFAEVARSAQDRAAASGYSLILGNSDERADREADYLQLFEQQRMRGVLISPIGDATRSLRALRERGIGAVLVDRTSPDDSISSVSVDDVAGGRLAVQHLIDIGRRSIAFVGGARQAQQVRDRLEGARSAVAVSPGARLDVIETAGLTVNDGRAVGERIAALPSDRKPDAIFAANDLIAVGLLQALYMTGSVGVPSDIALIGYDDIDFAASSIVPLSSIRQPSALIGATAVDILLAEAADPNRVPIEVIYQPELVVRASTGGTLH